VFVCAGEVSLSNLREEEGAKGEHLYRRQGSGGPRAELLV